MTTGSRPSRSRQGGFTLIELLIATALGVVVLAALSSVVLTTYRADQAATTRVEVSGEIRNFQQAAYDDVVSSTLPSPPSGCGTPDQPCTEQPLRLSGCALVGGRMQARTVSYAWDSGRQVVNRQVGAATISNAANVTSFSWYVDSTDQSVVVTLTVKVGALSQSQTMRFHPRVASQLPPYVPAPC